jgi:hypothetical protein
MTDESHLPDPSVLDAPTAELDLAEGGGARRRPRRPAPAHARAGGSRPPHVRLGKIVDGGLAPAIMAIVERGVRRRPAIANRIRAEVQLDFEQAFPPVRLVFGERYVLVEDGPGVAPDLRVEGSLQDLIHMMVTPLLGGVPSPIHGHGRRTLGMVAVGRVRVEGRLGLMRQLLSVIRV